MEFRGFVYKKRLTALSQYFHIAFFPILVQHKVPPHTISLLLPLHYALKLCNVISLTKKIKKNEIAETIRKFFAERIAGLIPLDNCVIDFGITTKNGDGKLPIFGRTDAIRAFVIELNPFNDYAGCGTDPGLFDWKVDRRVIDGEEEELFEFRIREAEFNVKPHIILQWRDLIAVA